MIKKQLSPRITAKTEEFYTENFSSLTTGATYILELFPRIYHHAMSGLRGVFSPNEIKLMVDAFNTLALTPSHAGQNLVVQIEDAVSIEKLDEKWDVDANAFLPKLRDLDRFQAACMEIALKGFWEQFSRDDGIPLEEWIKRFS